MTKTDVEWGRWATPIVCVLGGVVVGAAVYVGRRSAGEAAMAAGVLWAYGLVLVLGRNRETIGLLGAGAPDERRRSISRDASLVAGNTVFFAVLVAWLWEIAHGRSGQPYVVLGALGGGSFIAATVWLRARR